MTGSSAATVTETDRRLPLSLHAQRREAKVGWRDDAGVHLVSVDGRLLIGSSSQAGLVVSDRKVSRVHAELEPRADGLWVRDLGSTNGTVLDGVRIGLARVGDDGGRIGVGGATLSVTFEAPAQVRLWPQAELQGLVGRSEASRELFMRISRCAASDAAVLVQGETGTGKELVARALHALSPRAHGPLVVVDCGALPESMLESELFGHAKGAFTGASAARVGAIAAADGGTVFLDEIGELPLSMQPQLLRAIESHAVRRLGENEYRTVDVRFVAATHRDLQAMVAQGTFREDLYFRLAVLPLRVPPLRERLDDVPLLLEKLLPAGAALEVAAIDLPGLREHWWPGNVRELRTYVERALALGPQRALALLRGEHPVAPSAPLSERGLPPVDAGVEFKVLREQWVGHLELAYLREMIRAHGRSAAAIADASGLDKSYVHRLFRKHDL